jgi:ATP-dependent DNA helicase PIF1
MEKDINTYCLVDYKITFDEAKMGSKEISDELHILVSPEDLLAVKLLNAQQKNAYELILDQVFSNTSSSFFVDRPGGTGKTFLYRAILDIVRAKHIIALATTSSRVAASILPSGHTAHSQFKILLNVGKNITCHVSKQSGLAKLLRATKLIIWDKAPMAKKQTIEALDQMLQNINKSDLPFGGKVVVFGGDFRQVLPIVPKATRHEQIYASLVTSYLWPILQKIKLTENMRTKLNPMFLEYVVQVGNGTKLVTIDNKIKIPTTMIIPYIDDMISLNALIDIVFLDINEYLDNLDIMIN